MSKGIEKFKKCALWCDNKEIVEYNMTNIYMALTVKKFAVKKLWKFEEKVKNTKSVLWGRLAARHSDVAADDDSTRRALL